MSDQVLIHRPHHETDTIKAQLFPVIYRVSKPNKPAKATVHLSRMKPFVKPDSSPVPDFEALDDMFLGTTLPVPDLDGSMHTVTIDPYVIETIDIHERGVGATSVDNFQYHPQPTQCGVWRHCSSLPQCKEMVASYRAVVLSEILRHFDPPEWKKRTRSTSARRRK